MLMTWKKTAAGDVIYNKCPPNATGEGRGASFPPALGVLPLSPQPLFPLQGPPAAGAC